jgi:RecA/RadA recombinase
VVAQEHLFAVVAAAVAARSKLEKHATPQQKQNTVERFLSEAHTTTSPWIDYTPGLGPLAAAPQAPATTWQSAAVAAVQRACPAAPLASAAELLVQQNQLLPPVSSGSDALDASLLRQRAEVAASGDKSSSTAQAGGLERGAVTEVAGASAAGKTQLCLRAAARAAVAAAGSATTTTPPVIVTYIDTTGGFWPSRFEQLCLEEASRASLAPAGAAPGASRDAAVAALASAALERVVVHRAHSAWGLLAVLDGLMDKEGGSSSTSLVIVDSVSAVLSPHLGGGGGGGGIGGGGIDSGGGTTTSAAAASHGHLLLQAVGRALTSVAQHLRAAVLVTNHAVSAFGGGGTAAASSSSSSSSSSLLRPALGERWRAVPSRRLMLMPSTTTTTTTATLLYDTRAAPGAQAELSLVMGCGGR